MIISRTPLRVSLFGGGTDFKEFYLREPGEVISLTIDKSIYVTVNKKFDGKLHLRYSKIEKCDDLNGLRHDIAKECLKYVGVNSGVEIVIASDVPSVGTGLGSSSALTVGLLKSLFMFCKKEIGNMELAELACDIEINRLGARIGKQDQYACALGGFNHFIFGTDNKVERKLLCDGCMGTALESMQLYYIPGSRSSAVILKSYGKSIANNMELLRMHKAFVNLFLVKYAVADLTLENIGGLLSKAWELKKKTSLASNGVVEQAMKIVGENGGLGAKMCGAGQSGFLLSISDKGEQLVAAMEKNGFKELPFKFFNRGSEIVYRSEG